VGGGADLRDRAHDPARCQQEHGDPSWPEMLARLARPSRPACCATSRASGRNSIKSGNHKRPVVSHFSDGLIDRVGCVHSPSTRTTQAKVPPVFTHQITLGSEDTFRKGTRTLGNAPTFRAFGHLPGARLKSVARGTRTLRSERRNYELQDPEGHPDL
jgi:hypothetical protein